MASLATMLCYGGQPVVEVDRGSGLIPLDGSVTMLRDPGGALGLDEVRAPSLDARFRPDFSGNDRLGFTRDTLWLRVRVNSTDAERTSWFLQLPNSRLEWLDWYVVRRDGTVLHRASGSRQARDPDRVKSRYPTLTFTLEADEAVDVYIRIATQSRIRLALTLFTPEAYAARDRTEDRIYLACFGASIALCAAGLIFGIAVDFRGSFYYSANALCTSLYFFAWAGYWEMLQLPAWEFATREGSLFLFQLNLLTLVLYIDSFFELRTRIPALAKAATVIMVLASAVLLVVPFLPFWPTIVALEFEFASIAVFVVVAAIVSALRGMRVAWFYLGGSILFWSVALILAISWWRPTPGLPDPMPYLYLAMDAMLLIFLFCMADRARSQRKEKDLAQKNLIEFQSQSTERLERQVHERTLSLAEAKEAAERANRYKEMFLANISHEIRTPLSALISLSQAMCLQAGRQELPADFIRMLEQIRSGGRHLNLMLTNLLDASSASAGARSLRLEKLDLAEWSGLVRDVLDPIAVSKGLDLLWNDGALADRHLRTDPMRLSQILINLVHNAIKFGKTGTIEVTFDLSNDRFTFEVSDEGPGLPAPAEDLYQAFEQSLAVESDPTHGVGLGLYLVHANVELLGGRIEARSRDGGGTVFRVDLPTKISEKTSPAHT